MATDVRQLAPTRPRSALQKRVEPRPDVFEARIHVPEPRSGTVSRTALVNRLRTLASSAVVTISAPAGYGKTTLARQWSQRQTAPVAWYRTTRASGDVALLAVQLDDLFASVATELPREPDKVATIASINPSPKPLGRAILRTFDSLTRDVLLVVDEWEAAGTEEAEELLSMLVEGLDIRFLITTRTRPSWFTPRLEVYGEGMEIGVDDLSMTDDEAARSSRLSAPSQAAPS